MSHEQWCLEHIRSARWFAGKDQPVRLVGLTALPWWCEPDDDRPGVRSEIAELQRADGGRESYHLLLAYRPGSDEPADATADPEACRLLWQAWRDRAGRSVGATRVRVLGTLPEAATARRFAGEQSNTSVLYGDVALVKVFRRLMPGPNPDIEVHERLTRRRSPHAGRLLGLVRGSWLPALAGPHEDQLRADLAMIVEQFPEATDGWTLALQSCRDNQPFPARALGESLGAVHAALNDAWGTDEIPAAELAARLRERVLTHVAAAPQLAEHAAGLVARVAALGDAPVPVQRIHGDAHLGQVLRSGETWKWIDFEGEPATPIPQRVLPDSPCRDVAGVLRSFGYAAATSDASAGRRDAWLADARNQFLAGWARTAPVPYDAALVSAYEAERAAYEVVYEVRNRPDWVAVPLRDVAALATQQEAS